MSIERIARPDIDPDAAYCWIHMDDNEIGEGFLVPMGVEVDDHEYDYVADRYANEVWRVFGSVARRVVVVDMFGDPDPWCALGDRDMLAESEVFDFDRINVIKVAAQFSPGEHVIVGGFTRSDCVARVAKALERRGCRVTLHDAAIAPLTSKLWELLLTPDS